MQGIKINSAETDQASMPLGIFASKSVSCRHSNADLHLAASLPSRLAAKKVAFTLAEVLITLGIIGVVAAVTLPTLVANYQKTVWVNQLKKDYSFIANSFEKIMADEEVDDLCNTKLADCDGDMLVSHNSLLLYGDKYGEYLKLQSNKTNPLFEESAAELGAEPWLKTFTLNDGSCLATTGNYGQSWISAWGIYVDVNCDKKPNKWGRDRFLILYTSKGVKVHEDFFKDDTIKELFESCGDKDSEEEVFLLGWCYNKIIMDGWKMNY